MKGIYKSILLLLPVALLMTGGCTKVHKGHMYLYFGPTCPALVTPSTSIFADRTNYSGTEVTQFGGFMDWNGGTAEFGINLNSVTTGTFMYSGGVGPGTFNAYFKPIRTNLDSVYSSVSGSITVSEVQINAANEITSLVVDIGAMRLEHYPSSGTTDVIELCNGDFDANEP